MYSTLGYSDVIRIIYAVCKPYIKANSVTTTTDLRPAYLDFLAAHQPHQNINYSSDPLNLDRSATGELKAAYRMIEQTEQSINSVLALPILHKALQPWTIDLLERCRRLIASIKLAA